MLNEAATSLTGEILTHFYPYLVTSRITMFWSALLAGIKRFFVPMTDTLAPAFI